jgi:ABC-type polysaccharide/polyol phosphate export permease
MKRTSIVQSLKSIISQADQILTKQPFHPHIEDFYKSSEELKSFFRKHIVDKIILKTVNEIPSPRKTKWCKKDILLILLIFIAIIFVVAGGDFEGFGPNDSNYKIRAVKEKYEHILALIERA